MPVRRLVPVIAAVAAFAGPGCAGGSDDASSSDSALTLGPQQCRGPSIGSAPRLDASGAPVPGTARTTLSGCILGRAGETGAALLARAAAIFEDPEKLGSLTTDGGGAFFTKFAPLPPTGTPATALVQDADVQLSWASAPTGRLRVTTREAADGTFTLSILNLTALEAFVAGDTATVVDPGNLALNMRFKPESNGVTVVGTTELTLLEDLSTATPSSMLVRQVFLWIASELAKP
jgi:hypothetical protein